MNTTFFDSTKTVDDLGFLKLFNKLKEEFGVLKTMFSTLTTHNLRLSSIYINNSFRRDILREYKQSRNFLTAFYFIDAAIAIPFATFILTKLLMIPESLPYLNLITLVSAPIFSTILIKKGYGIIQKALKLNIERRTLRKISFPIIGGFLLLVLIPLGTMITWLSANHENVWRVIFDIVIPLIVATGICSAVYILAKFRAEHRNIEEVLIEYEDAKKLTEHNDEILEFSRNLKKEIEIIGSKFLIYVREDSLSQINKKFISLPVNERYILIEKIYKWPSDELFESKEQDVFKQQYFGPKIDDDEFVKFWTSL